MGQGVEWAIHCCSLLAMLPPDSALRLEKIAEYYDLPVPYLRKHFQALSRSGLVATTSGPRGGYRLARAAADISLLQIYQALEGTEPAFRCNEIRKQGVTACSQKLYPVACNIATSMWRAEAAWKAELAKVSLEDVLGEALKHIPQARIEASQKWFEEALGE